jgi:proliferating cell nuclear antigen
MDNLIFEATTIQSGAIRTLIEVLKDVLTDINIICDKSGMKIMAMDGSHVALIHMKLCAEKFEVYRCDEKLILGIAMSNFYKLIKTISNNDTISFYVSGQDKNELGINIQNSDKNSNTHFKLKLLDLDENEIQIPDVEINTIVTLPSNDFQRLCRDMINIADNIIITSHANNLSISCEGDFAKQETTIGEATHGLIFNKNNPEDKITGKFSLKYLNLFTKSTNLCNTIELYLKQDYPLILKYNVANLGEVRFCLAPKAQ